MKKILSLFAILLTASIVYAAGGVDLREVLTEEGYNKALKDNEAADISETLKDWNKEYIELGKKFRSVSIMNCTYDQVKALVAGTQPGVVDAFLSNFLFQNSNVMAGYLSDASFNDIEANYRKFVTLPGRIPKSAVRAVDARVFVDVVLKGYSSIYADKKENQAYFKQAVIRMLDKTDELPREQALEALKDIKRKFYKYITKGEDWKNVLTDLEIKIQSLQ